MPIPSSITDLSTTAASNSPAGSDSPVDGDNYLRAHASFIAQLNDEKAPKASPTFTGTATAAALTVTGTSSLGNSKFISLNDGRVYGTDLHNNANAVTGATNQYICSGTYTPTITDITGNLGSSTANACQWTRVGNVVTVHGVINITPSSANTVTEFRMTLPIASSFTQVYHCAGSGVMDDQQAYRPGAAIYANVANDAVEFSTVPNYANASNLTFTFGYVVL